MVFLEDHCSRNDDDKKQGHDQHWQTNAQTFSRTASVVVWSLWKLHRVVSSRLLCMVCLRPAQKTLRWFCLHGKLGSAIPTTWTWDMLTATLCGAKPKPRAEKLLMHCHNAFAMLCCAVLCYAKRQTPNTEFMTRSLTEEATLRLIAGLRRLVEVLCTLHGSINMTISQSLTLQTGQHLRHLQHVLDLPAVELQRCEASHVGLTHGMSERGGLLCPYGISSTHSTATSAVVLVEECVPDSAARFSVQLRVLQTDVNTTLKRRIKCLDTVRGQEHDAFVVLEHTEEDGDQLVSLELVEVALLQEDVCFVDEENCVPSGAHFEETWRRRMLATP